MIKNSKYGDCIVLYNEPGSNHFIALSQYEYTVALASNPQCKDSVFGNVNYFKKWIKTKENFENYLTENGYKLLNGKEEEVLNILNPKAEKEETKGFFSKLLK